MIAYDALAAAQAPTGSTTRQAREAFDRHWQRPGLRRCCSSATVDDIAQRHAGARSPRPRWDTVPQVLPLFWTFRIMVGLGFYLLIGVLRRCAVGSRASTARRTTAGS